MIPSQLDATALDTKSQIDDQYETAGIRSNNADSTAILKVDDS